MKIEIEEDSSLSQTDRRGVPWSRLLNRPMQVSVIALEIGMAFALFDRRLAMLFIGAMALFHVTVFVLAGILFWQNIAILTALTGLLFFLPEAVSNQLFGPVNGTPSCSYRVHVVGVRRKDPFPTSQFPLPAARG